MRLKRPNGVEALEKACRGNFNMIISDILMPRMDGFQLCRKIKTDDKLKNIPFIFYTAAYVSQQDEKFALSLGVEKFIIKPQDPESFINTVKEIFKNYEAGKFTVPAHLPKEETVYLKQYNERLIKKLEDQLTELGKEISERKQAEKELTRYRKRLELLVKERTFELEETNKQLEQQITERRRAENELVKAYKKLKDTHDQLKESQDQLIQSAKMQALGMLAGGLAHEMNNPMMSILNYLQYYMKHAPHDDKKYGILQDALHETKRSIYFLNNLLTFIYKGREERYQKTSCGLLFDRVFNLLSYRIKTEDILIKQHIAEGTPDVWMKANNIQQAFLNLITNALDAVKDKERKEITIDIKPEGENVQITISDNGSGITPENLKKIFNPFFTTKPAGKGTGLGLPIVKNIINAHGGRITCDNEPGLGSRFQILLPMEKPKPVTVTS